MVSGREGRGHGGLLYSHRYRGGISVAALQRWERRSGEAAGGDAASYFSHVESARGCDARVDGVGTGGTGLLSGLRGVKDRKFSRQFDVIPRSQMGALKSLQGF